MQVELYADYAPQQLMSFLVSSQWYPLEAALQVCTARGLVREQVFILGRMGSAHQALHVIIKHLADIPQVCHSKRCSVVFHQFQTMFVQKHTICRQPYATNHQLQHCKAGQGAGFPPGLHAQCPSGSSPCHSRLPDIPQVCSCQIVQLCIAGQSVVQCIVDHSAPSSSHVSRYSSSFIYVHFTFTDL